MDSPDLNFGSRLQELLRSRDLVSAEVADALGISRSTLFNWFNRDTPPPGGAAQRALRAFFGADADYLFGDIAGSSESSSTGATTGDLTSTTRSDAGASGTAFAHVEQAHVLEYVMRLIEAAAAVVGPEAAPALVLSQLQSRNPLDELTPPVVAGHRVKRSGGRPA